MSKKKLKIILEANDEFSRKNGLMHKKPLLKNECALFYFPREGKHSFWNKNVDFPISLIFCNKSGIVEDIKFLKAHQESPVYPESYNIAYVIEAHKDIPDYYKINKKSKIKFVDNEIFFEG